jgi:hypothetical protein
VDEIQDFLVLTNNYNAEYGQAGGLILNAVTESGENEMHGDVHMYFQGRNLTVSKFFYNLGLRAPGGRASTRSISSPGAWSYSGRSFDKR